MYEEHSFWAGHGLTPSFVIYKHPYLVTCTFNNPVDLLLQSRMMDLMDLQLQFSISISEKLDENSQDCKSTACIAKSALSLYEDGEPVTSAQGIVESPM